MYYLLAALAAVVIFAFTRANIHHNARALRTTSASEPLHEELLVLDRIAISVAKQTSAIVLDHSNDQIVQVETLVRETPALASEEFSRRMLVFGSYLGETLVRNHAGSWQVEEPSHPLPFLSFPGGMRASSFDLVHAQLLSSESILSSDYAKLIALIHVTPAPESPEQPAAEQPQILRDTDAG